MVRTEPVDSHSPRLRAMIITDKIDWVLISPVAGSDQSNIFQGFYREKNPPRSYVLNGAVLLNVDSLWRTADAT